MRFTSFKVKIQLSHTLDTGWLCFILRRTTASTPHGCQNVLVK